MSNLALTIGKGESKNFIFKLTDKDGIFVPTDRIFFAIKRGETEREFVFVHEAEIGELELSASVYSFLVPITSEVSRAFNITNYLYDLTLIKADGEEKPLIFPPKSFKVIGTIGASIAKEG